MKYYSFFWAELFTNHKVKLIKLHEINDLIPP